jgi:hypothetical protein
MLIMPASTRKQLSIRSDEAFVIAHELARKLGTTTTDVVVRALREFNSQRRIPSRLVTPEEADANVAALKASLRERRPKDAEGISSNHDYLYDEFGLPK